MTYPGSEYPFREVDALGAVGAMKALAEAKRVARIVAYFIFVCFRILRKKSG